jgi:uncharacterized short protein YbdD (DUF466 family)
MMKRLISVCAGVARALRAIVGVPDYERYITHLTEVHPRCAPLSKKQFFRESLEARYSRPGSRCC